MTPQDVVDFYEALSRGETDALGSRLAEEVVLEFPGSRFGGRFEGRRKVLLFLRQNQRLFQDGLRFTVPWCAVVGDRAVAQWTNAGTTREGAAYANRGVTVFRLVDGRIVEIQDYLDTERLAATWPK